MIINKIVNNTIQILLTNNPELIAANGNKKIPDPIMVPIKIAIASNEAGILNLNIQKIQKFFNSLA